MDYNNEWLFIIDELGSLLMDLLDTELLTYGNEYSRTEMWTYLSSSEHLLWRLFIIIRIMSFQLIVPSLNVNREGNNTALARMKEFLLIWWSFMRSFWFMHSLENAFLVKKISPTSPTFVFFSFINSYNERIFCWLMKLYAHILVYAFFGKCISGEDISNLTDIFFPLASINVSVLED